MWNPFKRKRKEMVQYGDKYGQQFAQPRRAKDGSIELHIKGEKYPLRSFPRAHVLHGCLGPLKRYFKNYIVEALAKCLPFKIPDEYLSEPVREMARVFDLLIEAEDEPAQKKMIRQWKDVMVMFLQEDDAWRFRYQWFFEHLNMKKIKLSKSDKYYFRAKSFKVDT